MMLYSCHIPRCIRAIFVQKKGIGVRSRLVTTLLAVMGLLPGIAGAQGPGWPVSGFAAGGAGLTSFYVIGFELGPWQEYLAQELTPGYLLPDDSEPVRISWLNASEVIILPDFAADLESTPSSWINLDFEWQSAEQLLWPGPESSKPYNGSSFERNYFSPGVERKIGDGGILGVSAVIAYQRYSAANLGLFAASGQDNGMGLYRSFSPYQESAYGTGVKLAVRQEIVSGFAIDAGYQSRIDMEEFAAYRGVYSQPADLDIPARARFGMAFQAGSRSWLNVAVERVLYSDINAFPSRYLPNRFLLFAAYGRSKQPEPECSLRSCGICLWRQRSGRHHRRPGSAPGTRSHVDHELLISTGPAASMPNPAGFVEIPRSP